MKKILFTTLIFCLALVSAPVMGAIITDDYVSDTSVIVEEVYIHTSTGYAGSPTTSGANAVNVTEPKPYPTGYPPDNDATPSHWDNEVDYDFGPSGADWIWDTSLASDPLPGEGGYDENTDRAKWGHAVLFKVVFDVPGIPVSANIHITADNCYSCQLNSGTRVDSATTFVADWETSLMLQAQVDKTNWQDVGHHDLSSDLAQGSNTLWVLAGNENYTDNPLPPTTYWEYNPGGAIFHLEVEYEEIELVPDVDIEKHVSVDGGPWEDADSAPGPTAMVGDPIDWKYIVTNPGQVPLTNVVVTDDQGVTPVYDSGDTNTDGILDLAETWIYYASGTAVAGQYTNIGTVDTDEGVTDSDPANYYAEEETGEEGCTPGFWKNNADKKEAVAWEGYDPDDEFDDVFGVSIEIFEGGSPKNPDNYNDDPTLLEALGANGSGINLLARAAVAALLNASNPNIAYPISESEILAGVALIVTLGDEELIQFAGELLDEYNNLGCPINQKGEPIVIDVVPQ
jgi:uncharacterized repeat protein (TIGR01451 family)